MPCAAASAGFLLAVDASWSLRIFFLARARKKMLRKRKKTPKKTFWKRFSLDSFEKQRGRGPSDTLGLRIG